MIAEIDWFAFYAVIAAGVLATGVLSYLVATLRRPASHHVAEARTRAAGAPATADGPPQRVPVLKS